MPGQGASTRPAACVSAVATTLVFPRGWAPVLPPDGCGACETGGGADRRPTSGGEEMDGDRRTGDDGACRVPGARRVGVA